MRSLRNSLRNLSAGVLIFSLACSFTGCSKKNDNDTTETPETTQSAEVVTDQPVEDEELKFDSNVVKVGQEDVTYREVLIYLLQLKNKYEPSLGEDIWNYKIDDNTTFGDQAKDELLDQITEIKIIKQQAEALGLSLENDEIDEVSTSARQYLAEITKEDQEKYGITEEMVQKVLEENYLAQKVYDFATNEVDTDISDEEALQIKVQVIQVMTEGENKEGTTIDMTDEEKEEAKKKAESLRKKAVKAEDFASFANENTDADYVDLTFGKGDFEEFDDVAFSLKKDEISDVIETSTGYFILKLVSEKDEDATTAKKEEIIETERNKVFQEKYKIWSGDYKVTKDITKWDIISFNI